MIHNRPYINKSVCVIIPCKNRDLSLFQVLPSWFCQIKTAQIVIVDYSSKSSLFSLVRTICERHHKTLDYNIPHSDADCLILKVENKPFFNMAHALNYGIVRTTSDVISIAGCESCPVPFYLELACNLIDDSAFTRCIRGRLTYPRKMIESINGYPELLEYWGGEDDLVGYQFVKMGAQCIDLDYLIVRNMQTSDFHDPLLGYSNEEMNLSKQYRQQESSIRYRNNMIANKFEGVKKNRQAFSKYCKDFGNEIINNYGQPYGDEDPILLSSKSQDMVVDVLPEIPHPPVNGRCAGKKCAVVIASCNRTDNLLSTLPMWLSQLYQNKQIVIVDYNSITPVYSSIKDICDGYKVSLSYNKFDGDADVILFRVDNVNHFNISHAYNYAVSRISVDVVSFACADTCPVDYYLDLVMHAVDEETVVQMWWGLITITYKNWEKLNGHQEFISGWGAEDTDFKDRALLMGLKHIYLPKNYAFHIPQDPSAKGKNREIKDINESNAINTARFAQYRAIRGYAGNYKQKIGQDVPVQYAGQEDELLVLHIFSYVEVDKEKLPKSANFFREHVYYIIINAIDSDDEAEWKTKKWQQWTEAGKLKGHAKEFISDTSDIYIDKFLTHLSDIIDTQYEKRIQKPLDKKEFYEEKRHKNSSLHCDDSQ